MAHAGHLLEVLDSPRGQEGRVRYRDVDPVTGLQGPSREITGCYVVRGRQIYPPLSAALHLLRALDPEIDDDPSRLQRLRARVYLIHSHTGQDVSSILVTPEGWLLPLQDRLGTGRPKGLTADWRTIKYTWPGRLAISQPGWYRFQVRVYYYADGRSKRQVAVANGPDFRCYDD
jgi:hypothetical protein